MIYPKTPFQIIHSSIPLDPAKQVDYNAIPFTRYTCLFLFHISRQYSLALDFAL